MCVMSLKVMEDNLRWQWHGAENNKIGTIQLSGFEEIRNATAALFSEGNTEDSGIVISPFEHLVKSSSVESNCYKKGGFVFLYKDYTENKQQVVNFPYERVMGALQNVSEQYVRDVLLIQKCKVLVDSYWAVCQYQGDYGTLHNHGSPREEIGRLVSGMFYLNVPPNINADTFPDGCLHLVTRDYEVEYVPPVEGAITIWPSDLIHGIHPFSGDGVRLGIAFNSLIIEEE